jgi:predicted nicotinamide N-methyase
MSLIQAKQINTSSLVSGSPLRANKNMAASVTAADNALACATAVALTPAASSAGGGYLAARVNGVGYTVGDGTKVAVPCYFSGDGGATARTMKLVVAGDLLYWNGTVALFELDAADRVDFIFQVSS